MPHKFDPSNKGLLVSTQRQQSIDVHRVLSLIPLHAYHVVADIGCGPGFFAIPLGKYVFHGKVFALDVQQEMLDATKEELERIHLTNVELVLSEEGSLPLEDSSLDGAFAAFVIHEADDPKGLLGETMRCLRRKGGWLALLEWHKREMDEGPPVEDRIDEDDLRDMAEDAGFRLSARHIINDKQYMLVMAK